jgi:aspartyl-tRNA(Asn)/glutamyl-tRNA(Gln) amidotransferase subunit C
MHLDKETLQKIAHLARLEFDATTEKPMLENMEKILTWVEKLNELDTDNVQPLYGMATEINNFREDKVKNHLPHADGLKNAPKKDSDYFRVPKVME